MPITSEATPDEIRAPEILVVEDEAIVALDLQNRLRRLGYRASRTVATAEAALRCIEEQRPDLVLMDIVLAGAMTGPEAAKLVAARYQIPIVYLTSHTNQAILEEIKETEEHGLLTKPFQPEQLRTALELALARYGRERTRSAAERKALTEDAQEHVQQFTYAAGHDLQEPLRTAACFMDLLARRADPKLDDEERKLLHEARDGLSRMSALLGDLLTYAQAGLTAEVPASHTSVEVALDRSIRNLHVAIAESGAEITRHVGGAISVDSSQLSQIFQNLLGNAIKYRAPGRKPVIHVECESLGRQSLFSVKDNGVGFDPVHAERIFQPFKRLHAATEYAGTGIGLAICKKIIEAHGGRIWAKSEPGAGSIFLFTLPNPA
jgi:light-regulated signal transduction histidine kinase (bacteriophytochrome)